MKTTCHMLLAIVPALLLLASCEDDSSGPNDVTSPRQVTNLTVTLAGADSLRLQWTAPGDDGGSGTAQSYQIRRSSSPITGLNFGSATPVPNPPAPAVGGTAQEFIVTPIDTTLETHFALRATDDAGNTSQVSNNAKWTPIAEPLHLVKDIPPFMDNSIYSEADSLSNGAGLYLFTGKTAGAGNLRRALMAFAVADSLPVDAVIDSVRLTVRISMSPPSDPTQDVSLHRLTASWGEEESDAGTPGGQGIQALPGDATWVYRLYDTVSWTTAGGDFAAAASATTNAGITNSFSTWSSSQMRDDVQGWLTTPNTNFGWIVIGNEVDAQSARRFDSRENPTAANRPRLRVYYTVTP